MAVTLQRHGIDVDVYGADAVRAWMKERIETETKLKGCPQPRVALLFDGHEETLDLDRVSREDPSVDPGATFQSLVGRPDVEQHGLGGSPWARDDCEVSECDGARRDPGRRRRTTRESRPVLWPSPCREPPSRS